MKKSTIRTEEEQGFAGMITVQVVNAHGSRQDTAHGC